MSESNQSNSSLQERLLSKTVWLRILYVLLFCVVGYICLGLVLLAALVQAVLLLTTGEVNANIHKLTGLMGSYLHQIVLFITFNSDDKPFPFSDFPGDSSGGAVRKGPVARKTGTEES